VTALVGADRSPDAGTADAGRHSPAGIGKIRLIALIFKTANKSCKQIILLVLR
jgi:hypothetical protein